MKQYFSLNIDEYHNFGDKDNLRKNDIQQNHMEEEK